MTCSLIGTVQNRVWPLERTDDEANEVHGRADHGILKEAEAGAKRAELARRHGVSEATIYNWKAKYGGPELSEAKRLLANTIHRVSVDSPLSRFSAKSRRVFPLVGANRTASSSNSCVKPFCLLIEFIFYRKDNIHFNWASPSNKQP
jgi:hypothetical protein